MIRLNPSPSNAPSANRTRFLSKLNIQIILYRTSHFSFYTQTGERSGKSAGEPHEQIYLEEQNSIILESHTRYDYDIEMMI
jgi:hypothetical protein